jgi:hypothetical protein
MNNSVLQFLVLEHIHKCIESSQNNMVKESGNKDKGNILTNNNPLCSAYSDLTEASRWINAYIKEYQRI